MSALLARPVVEVVSTPAGKGQECLEAMAATLASAGFRVLAGGPGAFEAFGPGMQSNRANPIRGFSRIAARTTDADRIEVTGQPGAARRLQWFVLLFPACLGLLLGGIFLALGGTNGITASLLAVSPWLVLSPMMAALIGRSTAQALRSLVDSAVSLVRMRG